MLELAALVDRTLHEAGVHPRLWSTGTTYTLPLERPLDAATARAFAARYFLTGLYARDLNVERMYFYNWGGGKIPIVRDGGTQRAAIIWTVAGSAELTAHRSATMLHRLDGTSHPVRRGDTITVGQEPVFVEG